MGYAIIVIWWQWGSYILRYAAHTVAIYYIMPLATLALFVPVLYNYTVIHCVNGASAKRERHGVVLHYCDNMKSSVCVLYQLVSGSASNTNAYQLYTVTDC